MRAHRVTKTPLLPQLLKQSRTGVAAEDDMQDLHGVTPRIAVTGRRKTQRELSLLNITSLGGDARTAGMTRRLLIANRLSRGNLFEQSRSDLHHFLVAY